jgi:hypothetical protein
MGMLEKVQAGFVDEGVDMFHKKKPRKYRGEINYLFGLCMFVEEFF